MLTGECTRNLDPGVTVLDFVRLYISQFPSEYSHTLCGAFTRQNVVSWHDPGRENIFTTTLLWKHFNIGDWHNSLGETRYETSVPPRHAFLPVWAHLLCNLRLRHCWTLLRPLFKKYQYIFQTGTLQFPAALSKMSHWRVLQAIHTGDYIGITVGPVPNNDTWISMWFAMRTSQQIPGLHARFNSISGCVL